MKRGCNAPIEAVKMFWAENDLIYIGVYMGVFMLVYACMPFSLQQSSSMVCTLQLMFSSLLTRNAQDIPMLYF